MNLSSFERKLTRLINEHGIDSWNGIADFIIARYIVHSLISMNCLSESITMKQEGKITQDHKTPVSLPFDSAELSKQP